MKNLSKLDKKLVKVYLAIAIVSIIVCIWASMQGGSGMAGTFSMNENMGSRTGNFQAIGGNDISFTGLSIAMGIVFSTCLYLINSILRDKSA